MKIEKTVGNTENEFILIAQSNGVPSYANTLRIEKSAVSFKLEKRLFGEGIVQFTLFSKDFKPLAERLVFMQPNTKLAQAVINSEDRYEKSDSVKLKLSFKNTKGEGRIGSYSVAVTSKERVDVAEDNETTIYTNLLLTSDLKGYVEKPNYYFNDANQFKNKHLDLLMLTQGWRRFKWEDVAVGDNLLPKFQRDNGLSIKGTITNLADRPMPFAKVNLFIPTSFILLDTVADANGNFVFDQLSFSDTTKIVVRAKNAKDRNNAKIVFEADRPALIGSSQKRWSGDVTSFTKYLSSAEEMYNELSKFGVVDKGIKLKEVEIVNRKQPVIAKSVIPFLVRPDYTLTPDQLQAAGNLDFNLMKLPGVVMRFDLRNGGNRPFGINGKGGPMLILLNGLPIKDISAINPTALAGVQVVKGGAYAAGVGETLPKNPVPEKDGDATYGIIFLTLETKRTKYNTVQQNGFSVLQPKGYALTREFYNPGYEKLNEKSDVKDFRSTIYWNSDLISDVTGNVNCSFKAPTQAGKYMITLEGITANGELVRQTKSFIVQ